MLITWRSILLLMMFLACSVITTVNAAGGQNTIKSENKNTAKAEDPSAGEDVYTKNEILNKATGFFGATSKALADGVDKVVEKAFKEKGRPNGYIAGTEGSGAFFVGLRYGKGVLYTKRWGAEQVYWQSPSVGFDFGGNLSKVFILVYHLKNQSELFQRIPGIGGSFYFVAGLGMTYQQTGDLILAPIRTGVGLRAGVNVSYMHFTRDKSWIPF